MFVQLTAWGGAKSTIEEFVGRAHRQAGADSWGVAKDLDCFLLEHLLVSQAAARIGVVRGAKQGLLEAPVAQLAWPSGTFHRLELLQGHFDSGVGQERHSPILFQRQQSLGKAFRERLPNEIAAVLAENIDQRSVRIPPQSAPDRLVYVVIAAF